VSIVCVTDAELVARARDGDRDAFGELVDRHRTAVFRAALAALGSHADADDAAQEAFVLAYRRLSTFREDASFKTWLLRIAWRQAINRRRSVTRWWRRLGGNSREHSEAPDADLPSSGPSPEDAAVSREFQRAIVDEIGMLKPKLKDALLLVQSGEYTYTEVAAMLRAPVGTIKWRVSEARRLVKQRLRGRGYADV
jgi:RNA polymerase sigma-70 factor (ECF subfamily)